MQESQRVARLGWADAKLMHYASAASGEAAAGESGDLSLTDASSISIALAGSCDALISSGGAPRRQRVFPGSIMLCGEEPIRWLGGTAIGSDDCSASDYIEITASAGFRREVADELRVPQHAGLGEMDAWSDPVMWAIAARFRSAARGTVSLDELERDLLLRRLYARVLELRFGGRDASRGRGPLDELRLDRVADFIEENLSSRLTIARLAQVAALSPFHFLRSFGRSFGMTPHRYVRARRFELARRLLAGGLTPRSVAEHIGYESFSHFRNGYRAHFGIGHECHSRHGGRSGEPRQLN